MDGVNGKDREKLTSCKLPHPQSKLKLLVFVAIFCATDIGFVYYTWKYFNRPKPQ